MCCAHQWCGNLLVLRLSKPLFILPHVSKECNFFKFHFCPFIVWWFCMFLGQKGCKINIRNNCISLPESGEKCTYVFVCLDVLWILRFGAACKYKSFFFFKKRFTYDWLCYKVHLTIFMACWSNLPRQRVVSWLHGVINVTFENIVQARVGEKSSHVCVIAVFFLG